MRLTPEDLRRLLAYDADTGAFTWLVALSRRIRPGRKAGSLNGNGYVQIRVFGRIYAAHRLAWLYVHGEWPPEQIDHMNGDRADNRIANLRPATATQNHANMRRPRDNTSGSKGVYWDKANSKWVANVRIGGKTKYLGRFDRIEDAAAAYKNAAHKYFGEFARIA